MKLKAIQFMNHPVLGDIRLDFCDSQGKPADNIIIAGENGSGKSTLLNEIYALEFQEMPGYAVGQGKAIYSVVLSEEEARTVIWTLNASWAGPEPRFKQGIQNNELHIVFDDEAVNWDKQEIRLRTIDGKAVRIPGHYFHESSIQEMFKSVFSDVEINFGPTKISAVTALNLDEYKKGNTRSSGNLSNEIAQLLVDVQAQDDADLALWVREHPGQTPPDSVIDIRMKQFKDAFHSMFPLKRYKGIRNKDGRKQVIFEESGKEISLDDLSSGEKQIIFRGGFLLQHRNSSQGARILIDEPEISLHPAWQINVLDFYQKLFTNADGQQTSQMFFVTHSPFIIHSDKPNQKVIVLGRDENGRIATPAVAEYYGWTPKKAIAQAFHIELELLPGKRMAFVEGETDERYLRRAYELFGRKARGTAVDISWIGRNTDKGRSEYTGHTALTQTKQYFLANPGQLTQRTLLLYDSDTRQADEDHGLLAVRAMPFNRDNTVYKKGIENLLHLPGGFPKERFYSEKTKVDDYGAESTIRELNKTALCDWICSLPDADARLYLQPLAELIADIERILLAD